MNNKRSWLIPLGMWTVFEIVAVTLWLAKDNLFYLLNFSYIGTSIALGLFLFQRNYKHARRIVQLLVGSYMLLYLGLICRENMQIEGCGHFEPQPFLACGRRFLFESKLDRRKPEQCLWRLEQ